MKHDSLRGKLVHQNSFQASKYPKYSLACLHHAISGSDLYLTWQELASHAGVFRGARISSLPSSPKNACVGG